MVDIVLILPGIVQVNVSIHAHVMCYSAQAFVVTMIFSHSNTSLTVYALAGTAESFLVGMEWTNKCVIQLCAASPCMTPGFDGLALFQVCFVLCCVLFCVSVCLCVCVLLKMPPLTCP